MRKFCLAIACIGILTLGSAKFLSAQQFTAVSGVVTDKTGGVIPDVEVTLVNVQTGFRATTTTNDIGYYQFLRLSPASGYELTFSKEGFRKFVISNISLGVGTVETHNATLELGNVSETVEVKVTGEATLNTTDAAIGTEIDQRALHDLPSLFRGNPTALLTLAPGVVGNNGAGANQSGSVTGSRADQMSLTLDGMDVTDQTTGQAFAAVGTPPLDSVSEVRTVSAGPEALLGRSSGGQVQLVTKSGTNEFHGNLREFHRNTITAANDFFSNKTGLAKPPLIRNQFGGSLGGPIKKDKFFFFFDYEGRRDALSSQVLDIVPLDNVRDGEIAYLNNTGGVSTLTAAQVAAIDPQGVGADPGLMALFASRYPRANDLSAGDGINTGGFRFNAPVHSSFNTYTGRLDYNLTDKQVLFARATVDRFNSDDSVNRVIQQFPGDPAPLGSILQQDTVWSVGHTWTITKDFINQASFGIATSALDFPTNFQPTSPNLFQIFAGITDPFGSFSSQGREVPVPHIKDDVTWTHGRHTFQFGADIKPMRIKTSLTNDFNFIGIGLGGNTLSLNSSLRPSDIQNSTTARTLWDNIFPVVLGRFSGTTTNFNYTPDLTPLPSASGKHRDYHYNEYEFYAQDSWKLRSDLTLSYGLRWQIHSVPFEANGFESIPSIGLSDYFGARVASANSGASGVDAVPLVSYDLGGSANHAANFYKTSWKDLAPRVALAYSPSVRGGLLGSLFGERKTSIRMGAGILFDRIVSAPTFELDQNTFLFDNSAALNFGVPNNPQASLLNDPRFTDINTPPPLPSAPVETRPNTPNVDDTGFPIGLPVGGGFPSFFNFDPKLKTPYSIALTFGFQRELPANSLLEVDYVGRLGRRLLAVGDSAQTLNALDAASGQRLNTAFGNLQTQLNTGAPVADQAWFENQMNAAIQAQVGPGATCADFFGESCTGVVADFLGNFVSTGDVSSTVLILAQAGLLNPNVALPWQTGANGYIGNFGSSNYHGLLVSYTKRYSSGLELKLNYTLSHAIDNVSTITNSFISYTFNGSGLVCDLQNLRTCRGSSDFDVRHLISGYFIYDLPLGKGRMFLHDAPGWVDAVAGGWSVSGLVAWRSGFPISTSTGTFPIDFTQDAPAVFNGNLQSVKTSLHTDANGNIQMFADPQAALGAFSFPFGGGTGNRNVLRGPGYTNLDLAVLKTFQLPWSERQRLQFRWESFNAFNHPNFAATGNTAIQGDPSQFGIITSTVGSPRQMQFALRFDF